MHRGHLAAVQGSSVQRDAARRWVGEAFARANLDDCGFAPPDGPTNAAVGFGFSIDGDASQHLRGTPLLVKELRRFRVRWTRRLRMVLCPGFPRLRRCWP